MVKGISKQVIVVHSQDRKLFDEAIFILSDDAIKGEGITNDMLLKEAKKLIQHPSVKTGKHGILHKILFAAAGASVTGLIWVLSAIL